MSPNDIRTIFFVERTIEAKTFRGPLDKYVSHNFTAESLILAASP